MEHLTLDENIPYEEIEILKKIGQGSFGIVSRGKWRDRTIAIKEFFEKESEKSYREKIDREIALLSQASEHDNIVTMYGVSIRDSESLPLLIMEYADRGSLHNYLHKNNDNTYTKGQAVSWALECAQGLKFLHGIELIHRDLKPANILLFDNSGTLSLKIADFGTVTEIKTEMSDTVGTVPWTAPEVLKGDKYGTKSDIYSWGTILWELFSRKEPYKGASKYQIMLPVLIGKRPEPMPECPNIIEALIRECWNGNPEDRPTISDIIERIENLGYNFPGAHNLI